MTAGRGLVGAVLAAALVLGAGACTDDGSKDAFCDRVERYPQLVDVLAQLDTGDPGGTTARLERAKREFQALEADAPGEIRADVARLRQGLDLVIEAVENNPDDLQGARQQILSQQDELSGLAKAGVRVTGYVARECSVQLAPETGGDSGGSGGSAGTTDDGGSGGN